MLRCCVRRVRRHAARHRWPGRSRGRAPTPSLIAAFSSRPVSSAMPKRPGPSASSTSSEVDARQRQLEVVDDRRAVGGERRHEAALHQIDEHRSETGLTTCAPRPHITPRPPSRARAIASATALKSAPARIAGSESTQPRIPLPGTYGRAKSAAFALLGARRQRIGAHAGQIELFVGKLHGGIYTSTPNCQLPTSQRRLEQRGEDRRPADAARLTPLFDGCLARWESELGVGSRDQTINIASP